MAREATTDRDEKRDAADRGTRSERVPLGQPQERLQRPKREGYHRHWINDNEKGRYQAVVQAGYTHVTRDDGSNESLRVGTLPDGKPLYAYLMEIPLEWYEQDQAAKQAPIDEFEKEINHGLIHGADRADRDAFYTRRVDYDNRGPVMKD